RLNNTRIDEQRSQCGAVADSLSNLTGERIEEGRDRSPLLLLAEWRIAAGFEPAARIEHVVAQDDVLARDVGLVGAASIGEADDAAVGRRTLRPINPAAFERQLLGRIVAGGQVADELRHLASEEVEDDDARAVVLPVMGLRRLVGIGGEQWAAKEAIHERDV